MCVIAAAGWALAGCDSGVFVNRSEIAGGYTGFLYVQQQAAGGVNAVAVRNSPFPPQAVLAALRARYTGDQYRFDLAPPAGEWNGYTVVIGFGSAPAGVQNLCQNPNLPPPQQRAGVTNVIGEYCYGAILVSEATGWTTSPISSPQDPRFEKIIGAVVAELFAYRARPGDHGQSADSPH